MSNVSKFLAKVKRFHKTAENFSEKFDGIVLESVELLWEHGNIETINSVIEASKHIKGIDRRALVTFYRECVPYSFSKEGIFGKKDKKRAAEMADTWKPFILSHNWYDFSKVSEAKAYKFDVDALINLVHKRLEKAQESGQLSAAKLSVLRAKLDGEVNTFLNAQEDRVADRQESKIKAA